MPVQIPRRAPAVVGLAVVMVMGGTACVGPDGPELLERAKAHLAAGAPRSAIIDLKNYAVDFPNDGSARLLLARAMLEDADLAGAEQELQTALKLGVPPDDYRVVNCRFQMRIGDWAAAEKACVPTPAAGQEQWMFLSVAQAEALTALQRPVEALATFDRALARDARHLPALRGSVLAYEAAQRRSDADAALARAFALDGDDPATWVTRGRLEYTRREMVNATQSFARAERGAVARSQPAVRMDALMGLAQSQLSTGDVTGALKAARELVGGAGESPSAVYMFARALAANGEYEEARMVLEKLIKGVPDFVEARVLMGLVQIAAGNIGQAESNLQAALAAAPQNPVARRALAELRLRQKMPEAAFEVLRPALEGSSPDPDVLTLAGRIRLGQGEVDGGLDLMERAARTAPESLEIVQAAAVAAIAAGKPGRAIAVLDGATVDGGGPVIGREALYVAALLRQGKTAQAVALARKVSAARDGDASLKVLLAATLIAAQEGPAARQPVDEAVRLAPQDPDTQLAAGRIYLALGDAAAAKASLQVAARGPQQQPAAAMLLAGLARRAGDLGEAQRWLQAAVDNSPKATAPRLALARVLADRKDPKAAELMAGLVAAAPESPEFLLAQAEVLLALGRSTDALEAARKLKNLRPDDPLALNNFAWLARDAEPKAALSAADRARTLAPGNPDVLDTYGMLLLKAGQPRDALAVLREAASRAPDRGDLQYHVATAYHALGRVPEARAALERALAAGGAFAERKEAEGLAASLAKNADGPVVRGQ